MQLAAGTGCAVDAHGLPVGDAQLLSHEIDTVDELGDGMLDLNPRVHLEEIELTRLREQELDRPGAHVPDGAGSRRGSLR